MAKDHFKYLNRYRTPRKCLSYRDIPAVDVVVADRVNDVQLGDVDEAGVVGAHR